MRIKYNPPVDVLGFQLNNKSLRFHFYKSMDETVSAEFLSNVDKVIIDIKGSRNDETELLHIESSSINFESVCSYINKLEVEFTDKVVVRMEIIIIEFEIIKGVMKYASKYK